MKVLITGATGFIGSSLVKQLLKDKHEIFCTLLENENNPFKEEIVKSIVFSKNSFEENVLFLRQNKIEGIIHLASMVQSGVTIPSHIETLVDTNVKFGTVLLEAAVHSKVKWFINTGTFWQNLNNESYSPVNLYAATKEAFMDIAKYYYQSDMINFATIKLFDTYGVNDNRPKIFNLWNKIANTGETLEMSPGDQLIDVTYVDDISEAFVLLAKQMQNKIRNLPNGVVYATKAEKRFTLKELALIFEKVTKKKLNIKWGGKPYREREVMVPLSDIQVVPGWKPKVSLEDGIVKLLYSSDTKI